MRPHGTQAALELVRTNGVSAVAEGKISATQAAFACNVTLNSFCRWLSAHKTDPVNGLKAKTHPGRPRLLTDEQLKTLDAEIQKGALVRGWHNNCWTSDRVRRLVMELFEVKMSNESARLHLLELGYTRQRPAHKTPKHDEAAAAAWRIDKACDIKKK